LPLQVKGTDYETPDGTCVRDYIDVTDLVNAHVKALNKAERGRVGIYNVGTGKGHISSDQYFLMKKQRNRGPHWHIVCHSLGH
jgi:UDP-glucose 4-epimerase